MRFNFTSIEKQFIYFVMSNKFFFFSDLMIWSETGLEGSKFSSERKLGDRDSPDT